MNHQVNIIEFENLETTTILTAQDSKNVSKRITVVITYEKYLPKIHFEVSNISSNEIQAAKYEGMKDATERIIRKIDLLVKLKILK